MIRRCNQYWKAKCVCVKHFNFKFCSLYRLWRWGRYLMRSIIKLSLLGTIVWYLRLCVKVCLKTGVFKLGNNGRRRRRRQLDCVDGQTSQCRQRQRLWPNRYYWFSFSFFFFLFYFSLPFCVCLFLFPL